MESGKARSGPIGLGIEMWITSPVINLPTPGPTGTPPDWKDIPEEVYSPEWNIMQMELVNTVERIRKSVRILQFG